MSGAGCERGASPDGAISAAATFHPCHAGNNLLHAWMGARGAPAPTVLRRGPQRVAAVGAVERLARDVVAGRRPYVFDDASWDLAGPAILATLARAAACVPATAGASSHP